MSEIRCPSRVRGRSTSISEQEQSAAVVVIEDAPAQLSLFEVEVPHEEIVHTLHMPGLPSQTSGLIIDRDLVPQTNTMIVDTEEGLRVLIKSLVDAGSFAMDTETSSEDSRRAELVGLSFSMAAGEAYYIPVGHGAADGFRTCRHNYPARMSWSS